MGKSERDKGTGYERELVNDAKAHGIDAQRAWGSNGQALGECEGVDCLVGAYRVQAKRRKTLPAYLQIPEGCDVVAFRQDRKETLVLMSWEMFLEVAGAERG